MPINYKKFTIGIQIVLAFTLLGCTFDDVILKRADIDYELPSELSLQGWTLQTCSLERQGANIVETMNGYSVRYLGTSDFSRPGDIFLVTGPALECGLAFVELANNGDQGIWTKHLRDLRNLLFYPEYSEFLLVQSSNVEVSEHAELDENSLANGVMWIAILPDADGINAGIFWIFENEIFFEGKKING